MEIEIRLKAILEEAGQARHGKIQEIAEAIGVHRHTIRKLYNNELRHVPLETLGLLCDWLERENLGEGLPGALFAARPSKLLRAMVEQKEVRFCHGEYWRAHSDGVVRSWVSRDDAAVASRLIEQLSHEAQKNGRAAGLTEPAGSRVRFAYEYVPTHLRAGPDRVAEADPKDLEKAGRIFRRLRNDRNGVAPVFIGSQRANYLVELYVADLFRSRAWSAAGSAVPFYLRFRDKPQITSCFGGQGPPPGARTAKDVGPGIYYRGPGGRWRCLPADHERHDAGAVIIRREPGLGRIDVAVFGLSGMATAATGKLLSERPDDFWPARARGEFQVGVYLCHFKLSKVETGEGDRGDALRAEPLEIVPLEVRRPPKRRPARAPRRPMSFAPTPRRFATRRRR